MYSYPYIEPILKQIPKEKKIIIYGVSQLTKNLYTEMAACKIETACFVVSDGHKIIDMYCGKPVYELSSLPFTPTECTILIATREHHVPEIIQNLEKHSYKDFYILSDRVMLEKRFIAITQFLKEHNVDLHQQTLKIDDFEIKNIFNFDNPDELALVFADEMGDLLLPPLFQNYDHIGEGAYELTTHVRGGVCYVTSNDVVLDCGANVGLFSAVAAWKGAYVYAFEPMPAKVEMLKKVCEKYIAEKKIHPILRALSDQSGEAQFDMTNASLSNLTENKKIPVQTQTIDDFVQSYGLTRVDFIKADIEGAERQMLKGAVRTLKEYAPKLSICTYHLLDDPEVLEDIVRTANPDYKIIHKWMKMYAYVEK